MYAITELISMIVNLFKRIPRSLISLLARFSLAATFLNSFSTKVEGIQIQDLMPTAFDLSKFKIADKTYFLFENVYHVPLLPSSLATVMATTAEFAVLDDDSMLFHDLPRISVALEKKILN